MFSQIYAFSRILSRTDEVVAEPLNDATRRACREILTRRTRNLEIAHIRKCACKIRNYRMRKLGKGVKWTANPQLRVLARTRNQRFANIPFYACGLCASYACGPRAAQHHTVSPRGRDQRQKRSTRFSQASVLCDLARMPGSNCDCLNRHNVKRSCSVAQ